MIRRFCTCLLILPLFCSTVLAQRGSKPKKAKVVDNQIQIQIVDYSGSVSSSGRFMSGKYLKIGESDEVPIKPDGSQVMKYFKKCPEARN
ncbi:MAG: hypothetical protein K1X82_11230 [Bacteroidia bacterium]|nr:hypothetical protein [Bacteroidia bacterium]